MCVYTHAHRRVLLLGDPDSPGEHVESCAVALGSSNPDQLCPQSDQTFTNNPGRREWPLTSVPRDKLPTAAFEQTRLALGSSPPKSTLLQCLQTSGKRAFTWQENSGLSAT